MPCAGNWSVGRQLYQSRFEGFWKSCRCLVVLLSAHGTHLSPGWRSRPCHRLSARGNALVGSVAEGQRYGIMEEPMMRAFVSDSIEPTGTRISTEGRWLAKRHGHRPISQSSPLHFGAHHTLGTERGEAAILKIRSPQSHGKAGGEWMATGCAGEHPTDQRLDNGGALVFETDLLQGRF